MKRFPRLSICGFRLDEFRAVLGRKLLRFLHECRLCLFIELGGRSGSPRDWYADLGEEFLLTGGRTETQQTDCLFRCVGERMRCVCRDAQGFASPHRRLLATAGSFNLTGKQSEGFLKIVAMRRRAAPGGDVHVNQAVSAIGVLTREQDRVGISDKSDVRQALLNAGSRYFDETFGIVSGERRDGLGSRGVLVHGVDLILGLANTSLTTDSAPLESRPTMHLR
jgi:hypothetical protein